MPVSKIRREDGKMVAGTWKSRNTDASVVTLQRNLIVNELLGEEQARGILEQRAILVMLAAHANAMTQHLAELSRCR